MSAAAAVLTHRIAFGLHLHEGPPTEAMRTLREEARLAEVAGFDGVAISEHHAGFPAYMPAPLLLAAALLGDLRRAFAMPAPLLLPLRPVATVAEEIAWLNAMHPDRVALGVAPGYQEADFAAVGAGFDDRTERFWDALPVLCAALRGQASTPLRNDAAISELAQRPVQVLAGVGGLKGAERAAQAGAGILLMSHLDASAARALVDAHEGAGGLPARILIRRMWAGDAAPGGEALVSAYRGAGAGAATWLPSGTEHVIIGSPQRIAESLVDAVRTSGATGLNLRLHSVGTTPEMIREQLRIAGDDVLPAVRSELGWAPAG